MLIYPELAHPEMIEPTVAVVVGVPEELFSDKDEICLNASRFVCARLEQHLIMHGHTIDEWIRGGCDEDWGVYFESKLNSETFDFSISFFPNPVPDDPSSSIIVQYQLKVPFMRRLFGRVSSLEPDHPIHQTMREFAQTFVSSRTLTKTEFDAEY